MDFRRVITVLAVLVLFTGLASAQNLVCNATAVPNQLRAEGITELVGDILLTCTGGIPGSGGNLSNVTVALNAPVTSRLLVTGNPPTLPAPSEALLLLNEAGSSTVPGAPAQTVCATPSVGAGTGGCANTSTVYQGMVSGSQVTFFGVPINAPATAGGTTYVRITNVRINANAIGNGGQAIGSVIVSGNQAINVNTPNQIVGYVSTSLTTAIYNNKNNTADTLSSSGQAFQQCVKQSNNTFAFLRYTENFGNAFKVRSFNNYTAGNAGSTGGVFSATSYGVAPTNQNIPGQTNNTESGMVLSTVSTGGITTAAGFADSGTRFKAVFSNVPAGVTITVTRQNVITGQTDLTKAASYPTITTPFVSYAELVPSETTLYSGAFTNVSSNNTVDLTAVNGQAVAVWEVLNSNPLKIEDFTFGVQVSYTASPATNSPAPGTSSVNMSYAPTSTVTSASNAAPIPRFVDNSSAKTLFVVQICRTILLFPFVTNQAGFDTGIAISNTSVDPFGTTVQAGPCTLYSYGANAPAQPIVSASVAGGTVYTTLASTAMPGFQGYVIAACDFQFAHGFAFISDLGARNLAMGYLALVVPDPGTSGRSAQWLSNNNSEILAF